MTTSPLLRVDQLTHGPIQHLSHQWCGGVSWVCGDEGSGKTTLLRLLAGDLQAASGSVHAPEGGVFWVDLQQATHDHTTVLACWNALRARHSHWQDDLQHELCQALDMTPHLDKRLHMLSAGSRRKVMLIAALASGATATLLDQPFAALDRPSIDLVLGFLQEASSLRHRMWLVADYEVPEGLAVADVLHLQTSGPAPL